MKGQTDPRGETITIAIADDDALAREGLKSMLQLNPRFRIVGETSDREGLFATARSRRPHLVIIDAGLVISFGLQLIVDLKEQAPQTKLVLMGITTSPDTIIRSLQAGAAGYIPKSASIEVFEDACLQVASGVSPVLPEMASDLLRYVLQQRPGSRDLREDSDLTKRQREVLQYMAKGMCNKEIAVILEVSETTVKSHVTGILRKLGVSDRTQAVVKALRDRLVEPDDADIGTA